MPITVRLKISSFAIVSAAALPAIALAGSPEQNGEFIADRFINCLTLPEGAPDDYAMQARMRLADGSADLVSINFAEMPDEWERSAAPVVAEAITDCEPYGDLSGWAVFVINPGVISAGQN